MYGVDNGNSPTASASPIPDRLGDGRNARRLSRHEPRNRREQRDWFCYQLASTSATSWTAAAKQSLQLGLVATSIGWTNVTTVAGTSTNGDKLTITFNQQTNLAASGTLSVCARTLEHAGAGKIFIGATGGLHQFTTR